MGTNGSDAELLIEAQRQRKLWISSSISDAFEVEMHTPSYPLGAYPLVPPCCTPPHTPAARCIPITILSAYPLGCIPPRCSTSLVHSLLVQTFVVHKPLMCCAIHCVGHTISHTVRKERKFRVKYRVATLESSLIEQCSACVLPVEMKGYSGSYSAYMHTRHSCISVTWWGTCLSHTE